MDTHVEGNSAQDAEISGRLYGGDRTCACARRILLGIGGVRLLRALNVPAEHYHVNEGHSPSCSWSWSAKPWRRASLSSSGPRRGRPLGVHHAYPGRGRHDVFSEGWSPNISTDIGASSAWIRSSSWSWAGSRAKRAGT